jgi:hypothetical protein
VFPHPVTVISQRFVFLRRQGAPVVKQREVFFEFGAVIRSGKRDGHGGIRKAKAIELRC